MRRLLHTLAPLLAAAAALHNESNSELVDPIIKSINGLTGRDLDSGFITPWLRPWYLAQEIGIFTKKNPQMIMELFGKTGKHKYEITESSEASIHVINKAVEMMNNSTKGANKPTYTTVEVGAFKYWLDHRNTVPVYTSKEGPNFSLDSNLLQLFFGYSSQFKMVGLSPYLEKPGEYPKLDGELDDLGFNNAQKVIKYRNNIATALHEFQHALHGIHDLEDLSKESVFFQKTETACRTKGIEEIRKTEERSKKQVLICYPNGKCTKRPPVTSGESVMYLSSSNAIHAGLSCCMGGIERGRLGALDSKLIAAWFNKYNSAEPKVFVDGLIQMASHDIIIIICLLPAAMLSAILMIFCSIVTKMLKSIPASLCDRLSRKIPFNKVETVHNKIKKNFDDNFDAIKISFRVMLTVYLQGVYPAIAIDVSRIFLGKVTELLFCKLTNETNKYQRQRQQAATLAVLMSFGIYKLDTLIMAWKNALLHTLGSVCAIYIHQCPSRKQISDEGMDNKILDIEKSVKELQGTPDKNMKEELIEELINKIIKLLKYNPPRNPQHKVKLHNIIWDLYQTTIIYDATKHKFQHNKELWKCKLTIVNNSRKPETNWCNSFSCLMTKNHDESQILTSGVVDSMISEFYKIIIHPLEIKINAIIDTPGKTPDKTKLLKAAINFALDLLPELLSFKELTKITKKLHETQDNSKEKTIYKINERDLKETREWSEGFYKYCMDDVINIKKISGNEGIEEEEEEEETIFYKTKEEKEKIEKLFDETLKKHPKYGEINGTIASLIEYAKEKIGQSEDTGPEIVIDSPHPISGDSCGLK